MKKLRPSDSDKDVGVTTPHYRPPDVFLGNLRFGVELDMWSFGCLVAELVLRKPLIDVSAKVDSRGREKAVTGKDVIDAIRKEVGLPGQEGAPISLIGVTYPQRDYDPDGDASRLPFSSDDPSVETAASFLDALPFFGKWYGQTGADWLASETAKEEKDPETYAGFPAKKDFAGCPPGLIDLIQDALKWKPEHRLTLSDASRSPFLQPPGQEPQVTVNMVKGTNGTGSILEADLDPDLLHFLQSDDCWAALAKERVDTGATVSKCVREDEAQKGKKTEIPGFVDFENPPKCRSLNRDRILKPIPSERFAAFQRALRKKWRPWLQQLQDSMRLATQNMPDHTITSNAEPILAEDFAHNAFAYASIQLMETGERNDGWHTDGGCSLLHAAVTLWGTRSVEVLLEDNDQVTLDQKPGSFYVGNLAALRHNVCHHARCEHTFSNDYLRRQPEGKRDLQIAVMMRCDVFRAARARKIDATPGPTDFFQAVNHAAAEHLATVPVALPDLTEVLDEMRFSSASVPQETASPAPTPRSALSD